MNRPIRSSRLSCLALVLALALSTGSSPGAASNKKKDVFTVRIHGEAGQEDGEKFSVPVVLLDGRKTALSIMPLLNEHDIKAIHPVKAPDGSYGAFLVLDPHGSNLLTQYSTEHMGRNTTLTAFVNGRQVISVMVDKPVKDGVFVIPSGMTIVEAARMVNAFPLVGQEKKASERKKRPSAPVNVMLPPKASDISSPAAP
jgi:hypothetical protein